MTAVDFSDLDDFDNELHHAEAKPVLEEQTCLRCCGRGIVTYGYHNIRSYECKLCKGTGKVTAQRLKRVEAARKARHTAELNLATKKAVFAEAHPVVVAWLQSKSFPFADSLRGAYDAYGHLSEKQTQAVYNCIARDEERRAGFVKVAESRAVDCAAGGSAIRECLRSAMDKGLKNPKLRTENLVFSLGKSNSKNPGAVYVVSKTDELYLGKITLEGQFVPVKACTDEMKNSFALVANDPLTAAKAYGQKFGICSCCGRELTDAQSVADGIGPICKEKFFGG